MSSQSPQKITCGNTLFTLIFPENAVLEWQKNSQKFRLYLPGSGVTESVEEDEDEEDSFFEISKDGIRGGICIQTPNDQLSIKVGKAIFDVGMFSDPMSGYPVGNDVEIRCLDNKAELRFEFAEESMFITVKSKGSVKISRS